MGVKLSKEQADALTKYVEALPEEKRSSFVDGFSKLKNDGKIGLVSELTSKNTTASQPKEAPQDSYSKMQTRMAENRVEVAKRGNLFKSIGEDLQSPNMMRKTVGGLRAAGAPFQMLESGIANPMLAFQRGINDPRQLALEAARGFAGQKQGQYGDLYRNVGAPEPVAATMGFGLSMGSPIQAMRSANKAFGSISKMSDAGIMKAGDNLIKATTEAEKFAGTKLNDAFKAIDNVKVTVPMSLIDEASKLPKPLLNKLEETLGNVDELAQNLTIGKLRQIKQFIGKYNPGTFGKEMRGLAENIDADTVNKVYGGIKKLMRDSIAMNTGWKSAEKLMKLESAFSEVSRATDSVRRTIVDPTLRMATKGGAMAGKITAEGDVTGRTALNILKKSGPQARKSINKAVNALNRFNAIQSTVKVTKHALAAATFGGAIGAAGGMIAGKALGNRGGGGD